MIKKLSHMITVYTIITFFSGCTPLFVYKQSGPPPHAKAYGHYKKYIYHYYPDYEIYYDVINDTYIVLKDRNWIILDSQPQFLISLNSYVIIESEAPKPWLNHSSYMKKYPPSNNKFKVKNKKHY